MDKNLVRCLGELEHQVRKLDLMKKLRDLPTTSLAVIDH